MASHPSAWASATAALDRLEEAVEARDLLLTFLTVEPRRADLAGHPRFTALLGKVGLKQ